ncbi:hypothetical protein M8818_002618 [Zalaria obscura]|uniref:Uncharacterized protein n=1 Tax=Zalaria obscura TaxID=2024903 RepID=A0ACC3SJI6_9PEZI
MDHNHHGRTDVVGTWNDEGSFDYSLMTEPGTLAVSQTGDPAWLSEEGHNDGMFVWPRVHDWPLTTAWPRVEKPSTAVRAHR